MKITFKLEGFEFKRAEFTKTFQAALRLEIRNAAREFAKAAIPRVPVRTGFARGSLLNLSDSIGLAAAVNPVTFQQRLVQRRSRIVNVAVNDKLEYYNGIPKTPENARQFATPIDNVFVDDGRIFSFNYAVTILYYEINDVNSNRFTPSAPWRSFQYGGLAFVQYLKRIGLKRLPAITSYLVKVQRG